MLRAGQNPKEGACTRHRRSRRARVGVHTSEASAGQQLGAQIGPGQIEAAEVPAGVVEGVVRALGAQLRDVDGGKEQGLVRRQRAAGIRARRSLRTVTSRDLRQTCAVLRPWSVEFYLHAKGGPRGVFQRRSHR